MKYPTTCSNCGSELGKYVILSPNIDPKMRELCEVCAEIYMVENNDVG